MKGRTETITVSGNDRSYTLTFRDGGNEQEHLLKVLNGDNYPLLPQKHFIPTQIIDIGAHVGASTIFFRHAYPQVPILCFEPCEETREFLEKNTAPLGDIEIFPFGLAKEERETKLFHGRLHSMQNSTHSSVEVDGSDFEVIQLKAANELLSSRIADGSLIKIDTEGCEVEILESLSLHYEKLSLIYLEYHSESARRKIDQMLANTHSLLFSQALQLHRGNVTYIANNAITVDPSNPSLEIG